MGLGIDSGDSYYLNTLEVKMDDLVKTFTEMFWSEGTLEMGFVKFVLTFVGIYVGIKALMYLVEGKK